MRTIVFGLVLSLGLVASAAQEKKADKKPADLAATSIEKANGSGKTMNVTVNPLGLLFGGANAQFDYALGESWAIGGRLAYSSYSSGSSTATGYGLGVGGTYFGNGVMRDGFEAMLGVDYMSASGNSVSVTGSAISAMAGYGWFWDGGFNMNVAGGIQSVNLDFTRLGLGSISGTLPKLAFNLGYAF